MNEKWTITRSGLIVWNEALISDDGERSSLILSPEAEAVLKDLQATTGKKYTLGILPGRFFTTDDLRTTDHVRIFAKYFLAWAINPLPLEVPCLARKVITQDDIRAMELDWLIFMMHDAVVVNGRPYQLNVRMDDHDGYLEACSDGPELSKWPLRSGFVFLVG